MNRTKKEAAAVSAVLHLIRQEEDMIYASHSTGDDMFQHAQAPTPTAVNTWGLNGRQTQMHMRNLLQVKAFHGTGSV